MKHSMRIVAIRGRQIFDSRGRPVVEAEVSLAGGAVGRASVPSGASTGRHEAHELRDGDPSMHEGRGVLRAVAHVDGEIAQLLSGRDARDQAGIDTSMRALDGTANLERLGANAVLAVSLAVCRAAALAESLPLHRYIAALASNDAPMLPMPMVNILSGGAHAGRSMDVQDFLVVPIGAKRYADALRMALDVRRAAQILLSRRGVTTLLADEGGLSPGFRSAAEALELMVAAIDSAGLSPGRDAAIAIDVAASELFDAGAYDWPREGRRLSREDMISIVDAWRRHYPVISVEDALHEDDWEGWTRLTETAGDLQLVGDDLFATNIDRIDRGIRTRAANAVLIKPNQNGTLSGALDAIAHARRNGLATIVSARSGETADAFIADLAVGSGAGQIKIGSVRSSERMTKYNRLLRIAEDSVLPFASVPARGSS